MLNLAQERELEIVKQVATTDYRLTQISKDVSNGTLFNLVRKHRPVYEAERMACGRPIKPIGLPKEPKKAKGTKAGAIPEARISIQPFR